MFARVITAEADPERLDDVVDLSTRQLAAARERPGFEGFYLLADTETGRLITLSLWATREQMEDVAQGTAAGIHDTGAEAAGVTAPRLTTYEVKLRV